MIKIEGYHGTDHAQVNSILTSGLRCSIGDTHWLGDGVYFFTEGKNLHPETQAQQWAILSSWDKNIHANKYSTYSVLKAIIYVEETHLLDLSEPDGIEILSYIKSKCIEKLKKRSANIKIVDGFLINFGRSEIGLKLDVVKGDVYIQLTKEDRVLRLSSRIPNCTICSVFNTDCISKLEIFNTGLI